MRELRKLNATNFHSCFRRSIAAERFSGTTSCRISAANLIHTISSMCGRFGASYRSQPREAGRNWVASITHRTLRILDIKQARYSDGTAEHVNGSEFLLTIKKLLRHLCRDNVKNENSHQNQQNVAGINAKPNNHLSSVYGKPQWPRSLAVSRSIVARLVCF